MTIKNNSILLQKRTFGSKQIKEKLFINPSEIISCENYGDVEGCLEKIANKVKAGFWVAGFITYEAGVFLNELNPAKNDASKMPLLWFGVYKSFSKNKVSEKNKNTDSVGVNKLIFNTTVKQYTKKISQIKELIALGQTYQVNFTFKANFKYTAEPFELYNNLIQKQSVGYSAFLNTGNFSILSISPELFFQKNKNKIVMRPMKGTAERGVNSTSDNIAANALAQSVKNKAENIMIVDMVRNDLTKICQKQSVKTTELFNVEKYETLFQMTSTVEGQLKNNINIAEMFKAIFPSGSVTGAPKLATMHAIDKLEKTPRGVYTGAIGYFAPNGNAEFNVAIRTLVLNNKNKTGEMGIGSGITYSSNATAEYQECLLKSKFLTTAQPKFQLMETMLLYNGKYLWLDKHLKRIANSANYFGFIFPLEKIKTALKKLSYKNMSGSFKVRLELFKNGEFNVSVQSIGAESSQLKKAIISKSLTNSKDVFLYHKTTNRELYNSQHALAVKNGFFDVIFQNEKGEITEGAITNVVIQKNNKYFTPPTSCGLLNGVFRQVLLKGESVPKWFSANTIDAKVIEKTIKKNELLNADKVFLINSVRGATEVKVFVI